MVLGSRETGKEKSTSKQDRVWHLRLHTNIRTGNACDLDNKRKANT